MPLEVLDERIVGRKASAVHRATSRLTLDRQRGVVVAEIRRPEGRREAGRAVDVDEQYP